MDGRVGGWVDEVWKEHFHRTWQRHELVQLFNKLNASPMKTALLSQWVRPSVRPTDRHSLEPKGAHSVCSPTRAGWASPTIQVEARAGDNPDSWWA